MPLLAAVCLLVLQFLLPPDPAAARGMWLIRDAEIEHTIRSWTTPLLEAAGLAPDDINIHIVSDPQINAFVAGGQRIFLTTGLLRKAKHPSQVKGVIAHEIGHIKGGHLARLQGAADDARDTAAFGAIFGVAVGALAGRPDAGIAGAAKAMDIARRKLLKYTREQERSADQVAVDLLEKTKTSARGLLELFESLKNQELLSPERQDPYLRSHPPTEDRIAFIKNHLKNQELLSPERQVPYLRSHPPTEDRLTFIENHLKNQELLSPERQVPYLRSHPPTEDRITFKRLAHLPSAKAAAPDREQDVHDREQKVHDRMVGKLDGFLSPPVKTLRRYKPNDTEIGSRYARAVALYRSSRIDQALDILNGLLRKEPEEPEELDNAYFHELRGQILFENGRLKDALPAYERAVALRPDQPLLLVGLAHVQLELGDPEKIREAASNLERAIRKERLMPRAWHLAAIAYGRLGRYGLSALALAENRILSGRKPEAAAHARKAIRLLENGSPARLRAQDILAIADPERKAPEK